jgi:hypothetical protein
MRFTKAISSSTLLLLSYPKISQFEDRLKMMEYQHTEFESTKILINRIIPFLLPNLFEPTVLNIRAIQAKVRPLRYQ